MRAEKGSDLSGDLIWCLRAMAQEAQIQFALCQCVDEAADDLVSDFEIYLLQEDDDFLEKNRDIGRLDAHILSKSGIEGYWNSHAMRKSEFWQEMREIAKRILNDRGLPMTAPEPLNITFINIDEDPEDAHTRSERGLPPRL